jgi:hypothetical protein
LEFSQSAAFAGRDEIRAKEVRLSFCRCEQPPADSDKEETSDNYRYIDEHESHHSKLKDDDLARVSSRLRAHLEAACI